MNNIIRADVFDVFSRNSGFEDEYLKKREELSKKIGNNLQQIEASKIVRKILTNAKDEDIDVIKKIISTEEYDAVPSMQKVGYFLYNIATTNVQKRVELSNSYLKVRDSVSLVIGMYNTYVLEEIFEFQYLCTQISKNGFYRILRILQLVDEIKYVFPFLKTIVYTIADESFIELLFYTKETLQKDNINYEQKIMLINEHIELLAKIDNDEMLKKVFYRLSIHSYDNNEIANVIERLEKTKDKKYYILYNLMLILDSDDFDLKEPLLTIFERVKGWETHD